MSRMGQRLVIADGYDQTFAAWCQDLPAHVAAADPSATIHHARNHLVTLTAPGNLPVVVKQFQGGISGGLRTLGRGSKARRSYAIAQELLHRQVPTPAPLAWVEHTTLGLITASAYLCAAVDGATQVRQYLRNLELDGWQSVLPVVGRALAHAHRAGVIHHDLSPGNLICGTSPHLESDWQLVDLNRIRFGTVRDAIHGATLLDRLEARAPERQRAMLEGYAASWDVDPETVIAAQAAARKRWLRANWLKSSTRGLRRKLAGRSPS